MDTEAFQLLSCPFNEKLLFLFAVDFKDFVTDSYLKLMNYELLMMWESARGRNVL
jgi:hypothetical protein